MCRHVQRGGAAGPSLSRRSHLLPRPALPPAPRGEVSFLLGASSPSNSSRPSHPPVFLSDSKWGFSEESKQRSRGRGQAFHRDASCGSWRKGEGEGAPRAAAGWVRLGWSSNTVLLLCSIYLSQPPLPTPAPPPAFLLSEASSSFSLGEQSLPKQ